MRRDADQVADVRNEGKHFFAYRPLEAGEDKQHPVWS